jgi:hypothetical protein
VPAAVWLTAGDVAATWPAIAAGIGMGLVLYAVAVAACEVRVGGVPRRMLARYFDWERFQLGGERDRQSIAG